MPRFNPEEYETVDQRTQRWYRDFPEGRVESELIFKDEVPTDDEPHRVRWGFKASVFRTSDPNEPPAGQGHAFEIDGGGGLQLLAVRLPRLGIAVRSVRRARRC